MTRVELLRAQSDHAYKEFEEVLAGVSQGLAWARIQCASEDEYLHTDGSIHSIVLHVATCKRIYGGTAFRPGEVRWRDIADELDHFEPDWLAALDYLRASQDYWTSSWDHLRDDDLSEEVGHFSGETWPAWRVIQNNNHHDAYHAGQIAVIRFGVSPTAVPPPSCAEDVRTHCRELPTW